MRYLEVMGREINQDLDEEELVLMELSYLFEILKGLIC